MTFAKPFLALSGLLLLAVIMFGSLPAHAETATESNYAIADSTQINELIAKSWKENGIRPAREATDSEWCRRVYLDLLGRIPTVAELEEFTAQRGPEKDAQLVDRLLGEEYRDAYARNWAGLWTNILIGRTGGVDNQSPTYRPGMTDYLEKSFQKNKPYHVLARELITASGDARPTMDNYNGAVNFLIEKLGENGVQATAKTASIFLGMNVQCTQCHNHPFNEHQQNQFWELNAFYRQTRAQRHPEMMSEDERKPYMSLVDTDFAGEGRQLGDRRGGIRLEMRNGKLVDRDAAGMRSAPLYYELRNGQVKVAYPVFIDGTSLASEYADKGEEYGNSGYVEQINRRQELAKLILKAPEFPRALVNRYWAHFFGHGFTKPIDDIGPHNPPTNPELLDSLAENFRDSEFDLKALTRQIVLSQPYRLSSRISSGNKDDNPDLGRPPLFSRFYIRQMEAEQLYESLLVATQADAGIDDEQKRDMMKERWLKQFNTAFGNDEATETTSFNGSIPQVLTLMNGDLIKQACKIEGDSFLSRVAKDWKLSNAEKINYLYKAGLSRKPTKEETQISNQLLAAREGNVPETLQDVWWAVLNSNEFILIH